MNRKLVINEPAKKILFKGKVVRTPVHLIISNNSEWMLVEAQLRLQGIVDYKFVEDKDEEKISEVDLDLEIEVLESNPTKNKEDMTILERLASEK